MKELKDGDQGIDKLMQMVTRTAARITMEDDGRGKGKAIWNLLVSCASFS